MNTTHITCRQCKRDSFLEDQSVFSCPYCGSDDVIEWGDGFICRDCGEEFGSIILMQDLM